MYILGCLLRMPDLNAWWRHWMETFSSLLALCAGNSPVTGQFPAQWPVTRSFDVFLDVHLNTPLSKQSWCWWFVTPSSPLWRHCNGNLWIMLCASLINVHPVVACLLSDFRYILPCRLWLPVKNNEPLHLLLKLLPRGSYDPGWHWWNNTIPL